MYESCIFLWMLSVENSISSCGDTNHAFIYTGSGDILLLLNPLNNERYMHVGFLETAGE